MKIDAQSFYKALSKINKVTPYLESPNGPTVIDISYGKMRAANSVQFWQVAADDIPDMLLIQDKAEYLESVLVDVEGDIDFDSTDSHFVFNFDSMELKLAKPVGLAYKNIEEIFLKPVLVNEFILVAPVDNIRRGMTQIIKATHARAVTLQLMSEALILSARDWNNNQLSYAIHAEYTGPNLKPSFSATEFDILVNILEDEETNLAFGAGTKTRPASMLARDFASGLTAVLPPAYM